MGYWVSDIRYWTSAYTFIIPHFVFPGNWPIPNTEYPISSYHPLRANFLQISLARTGVVRVTFPT